MIDYGDSYLKGKDITFLFIIKTFSGFWCDPHGQVVEMVGMVGMVGGVGGVRMVGAVGAVGGVKRGKLCQNLGTLIKFINLFKLIFNDINISLTPYILILHSLLYCFLEKHSIVFRI